MIVPINRITQEQKKILYALTDIGQTAGSIAEKTGLSSGKVLQNLAILVGLNECVCVHDSRDRRPNLYQRKSS